MSRISPPPTKIPISMFRTPDVQSYLIKQKEALRLIHHFVTGQMTSIKVYSVKTADYTIISTDYLIHYLTGSFTATLPDAAAVEEGSEFMIKNSGSGTITLDGNGSQTIDGAATKTLAQHKYLKVMNDGANWIIVGQN